MESEHEILGCLTWNEFVEAVGHQSDGTLVFLVRLPTVPEGGREDANGFVVLEDAQMCLVSLGLSRKAMCTLLLCFQTCRTKVSGKRLNSPYLL